MTSANLDLVRSIHPAWDLGDYSSVEWAHPEIEFVYADGPSPGTWKGLAGMAASFGDFLGAWADYRVKGDEYRKLDEERVLVLVHRERPLERSIKLKVTMPCLLAGMGWPQAASWTCWRGRLRRSPPPPSPDQEARLPSQAGPTGKAGRPGGYALAPWR